MYACAYETGDGFFEGVCRLENQLSTFRDPPLPLRDVRIARDCPPMPKKMSLESLCTHYQALLEGGVRGACLQRNHVPSSHLAHDP